MAEFDDVRTPAGGDSVFKDQCTLTFDTPESPDGLYVCMKTFIGFGRAAVATYHEVTGQRTFLHLRAERVEKPAPEQEPPQKKPTKMAIGTPDGFAADSDAYDLVYTYTVAILPEFKLITLEDPSLPAHVQDSAAAIIAASSASLQQQAQAWEEQRLPSKHAENLLQLDNGVRVPPSGYKCAKCDISDNLWLNLTDGTILCGRKFYDGSGGNNHAIDHYEQTKYPLAVKLGTITPEGADVYSYEEDDMVLDPKLSQHLAHFGINIQEQRKTAKSMAEMEIEANEQLKFEFDRITEAGVKLEPAFGPGFTGMRNLGNSCYMNSVLQVLFSLRELVDEFQGSAIQAYHGQADPTVDLELQLHKLGHGLQSGQYSNQPEASDAAADAELEQDGIDPKMTKHALCRDHPEFSTGSQQDASEFWSYMMTKLSAYSKKYGRADFGQLFEFDTEVRYHTEHDAQLHLPVRPEDSENWTEHQAYQQKLAEAKANKTKVEGENVPLVLRFDRILNSVFAPAVIEDWYSPAIKAKTTATLQRRFKSFPRYLLMAVDKFFVGDDWTPQKRDASITMPEEMDLTPFAASEHDPNEELLPEEEEPAAEEAPAIELDPDMLAQLAAMGFAEEGCKRAVYHNPNSVEAAMEWIFAHQDDADFAAPFTIPGTAIASGANTSGGAAEPPAEAVGMLEAMGFSTEQARRALRETDNNLERAADWAFNHPDEMADPESDLRQSAPSTEAPASERANTDQPQFAPGTGRYRLKAIISHMGTAAQSGHYICHIRKGDDWFIFNDRKVAKSVKPPFDLGYLYLYESRD